MKLRSLISLVLGGMVMVSTAFAAAPGPNIVLIITDDLGYGDLGCYGAKRIATPNVDRLAAEGVRFTRGYAPSSTCTPTRYSIFTGEYAWRRPVRQTGVLNGDAPLAIPPGSLTLVEMLKRAGYVTGLVGKWHLGLGDGSRPLDFNGEIKPGPLEIGFDSAYFIPATVDRVPCVFIDGHRVAGLDPADPIRVSYPQPIGNEPVGTNHPEMLKVLADAQHSGVIINGISRIGYMTGGTAALWTDEDIADVISRKAVEFLEANRSRPFFLCFGTHDPHVPRAPHPRFRGQSGCGIRGDTVVQMDWCVGEILKALDRLELADNTLVIFTSDNGPVLFDGYFDKSDEEQNGHLPAGGLRGWKYLVYEGGCRVPLIFRWPSIIKPRVTDQTFNLVDLFATIAAITGQKLRAPDAPDSLDLSRVLLGQTRRDLREFNILHGISGGMAVRQGDWKYIPANTVAWASGIGEGANPSDKRFAEIHAPEALLFNLADDPGEATNVIRQFPRTAAKLEAQLNKVTNDPGKAPKGSSSD
jgi:arylsulfatase A-like enzyme